MGVISGRIGDSGANEKMVLSNAAKSAKQTIACETRKENQKDGFQMHLYGKLGKDVRINGGIWIHFFYLGVTVLSFFNCRNSTVGMIKEIGINSQSRYYPKHYIIPKRWMRKFFHINQRTIPRYLYFELLVSVFFLILGLFNTAIFIVVGCDKPIAGILFMFHICLIIINAIFFSITSLIFKRK